MGNLLRTKLYKIKDIIIINFLEELKSKLVSEIKRLTNEVKSNVDKALCESVSKSMLFVDSSHMLLKIITIKRFELHEVENLIMLIEQESEMNHYHNLVLHINSSKRGVESNLTHPSNLDGKSDLEYKAIISINNIILDELESRL